MHYCSHSQYFNIVLIYACICLYYVRRVWDGSWMLQRTQDIMEGTYYIDVFTIYAHITNQAIRVDTTHRASNGRFSPYFADHQVEIFFHVSTMMPLATDDDQQVHSFDQPINCPCNFVLQIGKKKHIGNDAVHIVFSDEK